MYLHLFGLIGPGHIYSVFLSGLLLSAVLSTHASGQWQR